MIQVLIADDHTLVRKGLKGAIEQQPDMRVVGEAADGVEALHLARAVDWDVLLLDIAMPRRNGMEVLQEVKRDKPHLPILMLSVYAEQEFGIRVLKAGAAGFINKIVLLDELIPAIRKVAAGGRYVSRTLAEQFANQLSGDAPQTGHAHLSDREYQIMCMLGAGKTPTVVGEELVLSVKTVSTYRSRILLKLGLKNTADLIRYVMKHHLD